MGAKETDAAARLAPLLPELKLQTRLSRLVAMPIDDVHRYIFVSDRRKLGMGITASVHISAFYLPLSISLCHEALSVTVGRVKANVPVEELDAELAEHLRGSPIRLLRQVGTPFGFVDYLRSSEFTKQPAGMFEYGMALARAGALHEAGRRLLDFLNMRISHIDRLVYRLMSRAQEMLDTLYEKDSRRDELFETWILEGKREWGLVPQEEADDDEEEDDDRGVLGKWEPGKARW